MIWVNKIKDLQYYHQGDGQYCYCDLILFGYDIGLQARISQASASSTCNIYQYSVDGLTQIADITSSFDWYIGTDGKGNYFCNARMTTIFPACDNPCFILRVVINEGGTTLFDKFTEQYCIQSCCVPISSVTYTQAGYDAKTLNADVFSNESGFGYVIDSCGNQVMVFIGSGTCYNATNGYHYGLLNRISGSSGAFRYQSVTNLHATAQILPREIVRTISRNCRTQETERVQKFRIQGQEQFPLWKMQDLEDTFAAENLYIATDSTAGMGELVLDTTTPFQTFGRRHVDQKYDRFKLDFEARQCRQFQMFGCTEKCIAPVDATMAFVVPANNTGFYDEGGSYIAEDTDGLLVWLRSLDQSTNAAEVYLSPVNSQWSILTVAGYGYLPSAVYANSFNYANKIPAILITNDTDYGSLIPVVPCGSVTIGVITSEEQICNSVTIGTVTNAEILGEAFPMLQYDNWLIDTGNTSMTKMGNVVQFSLKVFNSSYPLGSPSPVVVPNLSGEIIAVLPYECRPTSNQNFDHNLYSSIPNGANIIIDTNGYIYYSGPVSSADMTGSTIDLSNILFYL